MNKISYDPTYNFFMMQDIELPNYRELVEMVNCATKIDEKANDSLVLRVMKRVTDAAYTLLQLTNGFDGKDSGKICYHWLPVKFYMALTTDQGDHEHYDGFKITVSTPDVAKEIEIFFARSASPYKYGVFERHQLGGWSNRIPAERLEQKPEVDAPKQIAHYTVWNEMRSEGFVTLDKQLAYETRKGATTNLCDEFGNPSPVAAAFCEQWGDGNLTTEVTMQLDILGCMTAQGLADLFEYYENAHAGDFSSVQNKRNPHPTVHALMLLNELCPLRDDQGCPQLMPLDPNTKSFLNYDYKSFMMRASRDHVLELVRCGVGFDAGAELFDLSGGNN